MSNLQTLTLIFITIVTAVLFGETTLALLIFSMLILFETGTLIFILLAKIRALEQKVGHLEISMDDIKQEDSHG